MTRARRGLRRTCLAALVGALAVTAAGSGQSRVADRPVDVRTASVDFPESELPANLHGEALQAQGFSITILASPGSRELVEPAL